MNLALHLLSKLQNKLRHDSQYADAYCVFMQDIEKGFAEKVPAYKRIPRSGIVNYITHHGIYHPQKPGEICVVFACSAKFKGRC